MSAGLRGLLMLVMIVAVVLLIKHPRWWWMFWVIAGCGITLSFGRTDFLSHLGLIANGFLIGNGLEGMRDEQRRRRIEAVLGEYRP